MSFEEKMKQDLKKDLEIPEIVEQKIQDAYKEIGQGKLRMKKPDNRNQKRKKVWTTAAAAVAVIAVSGTVLYSNPVLAKNIPVIGDVFAKMQENRAKDPYAGKDKTAYEKIEDYSANVQTPGSEAEDNGVTVTVSDAYCDGYQMYFTMTATTDNEQINQIKGLTAIQVQDEAGREIYRSQVSVDESLTHKSALTIDAELRSGNPAIHCRKHLLSMGILSFDTRPLGKGDKEIIAARLKEIVEG